VIPVTIQCVSDGPQLTRVFSAQKSGVEKSTPP
jgi:hypothetical protein